VRAPISGARPPNEWELVSPFSGKNTSKMSAIATDATLAEIWPGPDLVNGRR
jgi:hypothetical protein